jgi:hypothetical protein
MLYGECFLELFLSFYYCLPLFRFPLLLLFSFLLGFSIIREKCSYYFEPKANRPPSNNPEHLTGTHLYAHFTYFPSSSSELSSLVTNYNVSSFQDSLLDNCFNDLSDDIVLNNLFVKEKDKLIQVSYFLLVLASCFVVHLLASFRFLLLICSCCCCSCLSLLPVFT